MTDTRQTRNNFDEIHALSKSAAHQPKAEVDCGKASPMILIVEDDADVSFSLQIRLQVHGFRVSQAFDAVLAMDVAKQYLPDVVLLDIGMPGGSGFDVARRLRDDPETAHVPVIFLTASQHPDSAQQASEAGGRAFLTKPFDSGELIAEIRRHLPGAYELD